MRQRRSAWAKATACAPCRWRRQIDERRRAAPRREFRPLGGQRSGEAASVGGIDDAAMVNFDGIPGPTHNYSGLARGNLAAERNAQQVANPREAALQGLAKMRAL